MKKLLTIILLAVFFFSCEKEECYECKTTLENISSTKILCDYTEEEISKYENENTFQSSSKNIITGYQTIRDTTHFYVFKDGFMYDCTHTAWHNHPELWPYWDGACIIDIVTKPIYSTISVWTRTNCNLK